MKWSIQNDNDVAFEWKSKNKDSKVLKNQIEPRLANSYWNN